MKRIVDEVMDRLVISIFLLVICGYSIISPRKAMQMMENFLLEDDVKEYRG